MKKTPEPGELITLREAATLLGCHPRTVRIRIARGELPAYRLGDSPTIRILEADLHALLRRIPTMDS